MIYMDSGQAHFQRKPKWSWYDVCGACMETMAEMYLQAVHELLAWSRWPLVNPFLQGICDHILQPMQVLYMDITMHERPLQQQLNLTVLQANKHMQSLLQHDSLCHHAKTKKPVEIRTWSS